MAQGRETTTRAYTLKLQCSPEDKKKLWLTHEAVNKGAKVFGDWLLTLRGGLSHELANKDERGKKISESDKKNRRILLALSWLSVESKLGAPDKYIIASGEEAEGKRIKNVIEALKDTLIKRGLKEKEVQSWVADCEPSLSASIRHDAVWVNRSEIFDHKAKGFSQDDIWDMLEYFFNGPDSYLAHEMNTKEQEQFDELETPPAKTKKVKELVQKAGNWLSKRFGEGKGTDFKSFIKVYENIAEWAAESARYTSLESALPNLIKSIKKFGIESEDIEGVQGVISGPGYKSGTKTLLYTLLGKNKMEKDDWKKLEEKALADVDKSNIKDKKGKGARPYSDAIKSEVETECGITYLQKDGPSRHKEFCVILDHAAHRVALAHTWIKKAEAERRKFEEDASCKEKINAKIIEWLDSYCEKRGKQSGSETPIRIRRRAIDGWEEVIKAWSKKGCVSDNDRINAARNLQAEIEKFGDIKLFENLASDEAKIIWSASGKSDADSLKNYVRFKEAEAKKREFKVPAYRHPDMYLHPVFCDFGYSRWDISYALHDNDKKVDFKDYKNVKLKLFDGAGLIETELKWQSKKFMKDIAATFKNLGKGIKDISRADRQGMAVANEPDMAKVRAAGVFEFKNWNGRLQASRKELEKIEKAIRQEKSEKVIKKMTDNINWLLSFSAEVEKIGPWFELEKANKSIKLSLKYGYNDEKNRKRGANARVVLSRIPGIRILSIDLGHRYAAACAVWETVSNKQLKEAGIKTAKEPYVFVKEKKDGKDKTTIYRRIGPDEIGKGKEHPAPWTRLDRQFLIKLQGEDRDARRADENTEYNKVKQIASELGYKGVEKLPWNAAELMSESCYILRSALRRNGMLAKATYNFMAECRIKPGGQKEKADEQGKIENVLSGINILKDFAESNRWDYAVIKDIYDKYLLNAGAPKPEIQEEIEKKRSKENNELKNKLRPVAEKILKSTDRSKIIKELTDLWKKQDETIKNCIKWISHWVFPRGNNKGKIWNVGGLSLDRIAIMKAVYQIKKAYKTKPEPDDITRNIPKENDHSMEKFAQKTLDKMEKLREQRVKQLASRIVEAALGIGVEKKNTIKKYDRPDMRDIKRPNERINDPRFTPCHAIVIENLENYRPEETRTRRENRQLMIWSSSKVAKYLSEACELNGLHLRQVQAGYTSRQDSRTGAPGIRCSDKPVKDFVKIMTGKIKKINENFEKGGSEEDKYLKELYNNWNEKESVWTDKWDGRWKLEKEQWLFDGGTKHKNDKGPHPVRIPQRGGEIFVSSDPDSPLKNGIQADLNAAANIGLKALLDPDWNGRWWYVPCNTKDYVPSNDKVKGSMAFEPKKPLMHKDNKEDAKGKNKKDIVNLWKDISEDSLYNGNWREFKPYWNDAAARAIKNLRG